MQSRIPADWPFKPARTPLFYGWVIWLVSTLGFLASIPGQTMGMAVFTDPLIQALGLTRTELSLAYLFGTMVSSVFLTQAGRWYDRYGGRIMVTVSSFLLAIVVMYISTIDLVLDRVGDTTALAFVMIFLGYFGVRFFGQGILTSCSRNILLTWFVRRRGLVSGIRGVVVSFGFSVAPLVLAAMIASLTWRGALWSIALVVGIGFSLVALVLLRDSPASCGLAPDGDKPSESEHALDSMPSLTLRDARRSPAFWIYAGALATHAMFGTALTFHVVSIFAEAGRSQTRLLLSFCLQQFSRP